MIQIFNILVEEANFNQLKFAITRFGLASGLWPNWNKSLLFWVSKRAPQAWLDFFGCSWVAEQYLAKMLGTSFNIRMDIVDIDAFMMQKIQWKLSYWLSIHLSLAGRQVIINSIFLSTLWFFICVWGGTLKVICSIKAIVRNFLWSGSVHHSRTRVTWTDCCLDCA